MGVVGFSCITSSFSWKMRLPSLRISGLRSHEKEVNKISIVL